MKAAIIGGGLGGMAAAITLANAGVEVHLYEKNQNLGGKMQAYRVGDAHFDFGPNTITMPHIFKQVIENTGVDSADYLSFIPLVNHSINHFSTGESLVFTNNQSEMKERIAQFSKEDADNYPAFIKEITKMYELSSKHFLNRSFLSIKDYWNPKLAYALARVHPFQTLEQFINTYFQHPLVVQSFLRYATYIGSSPYKTPATFAMIAYLELVEGVYYIKGGTSYIAKAFERRMAELGVSVHVNSEITDIYSFKYVAHALEVNSKIDPHIDESYDFFIMNGDVLYHKEMLSYAAVNTREPSTSALVMLATLNKKTNFFQHHNVYFGQQYEAEFDSLFKGQYASDPTIYICNSSVTDTTVSPTGDNLLILLNAPALTKSNNWTEQEFYRYIMDALKQKGIEIEDLIDAYKIISPEQLKQQFHLYRGTLYGQASHTKKTAFLRTRNKHPHYKNIYFAGGTVHPGGGSPLAVLSGYQLALSLLSKYKKSPSN